MVIRRRLKKAGELVLARYVRPSEEAEAPQAAAPTASEAAPTAAERTARVRGGKLLREDDTPFDLVLYKFDSCPYARRVMRCLDELGIEVERRDTRKDIEAMRSLRDLTGRTQVPCLVIDGEPMLESEDIMYWLRKQAAG